MSATPSGADRAGDGPLHPRSPRLESVDVLRGAIMVLMALDHVRDFFGDSSFDPTDLSRTTPALFLTRWITHFCAPVFVFLAGVGAWFAGSRGRTRGELARYLLIRGAWLILLEETWIVLTFSFGMPKVVLAVVLWAIGWSMIGLAGLIYLPRIAIGAIGLGMIAAHNLFDGVQFGDSGALATIWKVLHVQSVVPLPGGYMMFILYPLIPWVGVMASGYAFAPVLLLGPDRRRMILQGLGLALTIGFVLLRATNLYGDPRAWKGNPDPIFSVLSFLNCQKYPPSMLFLMMTLGPALVVLAGLDSEGKSSVVRRTLRTLGRVPLFYYLLQWPVIHGLALLFAAVQGQPTGWLFGFPPQPPLVSSYSLPMVYLFWAVVVFLLYWPCQAFGRWKQGRRDAWLSYL